VRLLDWLRTWAKILPRRLAGEVDDAAAYRALGELLAPFAAVPVPPDVFASWERRGFHLTRSHYYSPIPEVCSLPESLWQARQEATGIDFNEPVALDLLTRHFPAFAAEYSQLPHHTRRRNRFAFDNPQFTGTDALVLYCMVRHFRPGRIVEVGCGHSSLLSGRAAVLNGATELICIDPRPPQWLSKGFPGLTRLIADEVQAMPLELFTSLRANDILFLDGSHVAKAGSDVTFLFLEVLPRLAPGVIVHVHDVFLPDDYPRSWVVEQHYFWNEQYLLHAFLLGNTGVEVLFGNTYMARRHPEAMRRTFPGSPWWGGGSFWFRFRPARRGAGDGTG
jgi:hypothetical protein